MNLNYELTTKTANLIAYKTTKSLCITLCSLRGQVVGHGKRRFGVLGKKWLY